MRALSFRLAMATTIVVMLAAASAGGTNPPLEQLSLRDALLAKPEVIAALSAEAHQQLALRLEDARRHPGGPMETLVATEFSPVEQIRQVDLARLARGRDSLIAGQLRITAVGLEVAPYTDELAEPPSPLPTLSGIPADLTAEEEASALRGVAGAVVRGLLQLSQASLDRRLNVWFC